MGLLTLPLTVARTAATAITDTAGAVGAAAADGAIGGVRGAIRGVAHGLHNGSRSTPTAALTLAAVGAAGLIDWPILILVGGTGLLLRQRPRQTDPKPAIVNRRSPSPSGSSSGQPPRQDISKPATAAEPATPRKPTTPSTRTQPRRTTATASTKRKPASINSTRA